MQNQYRIHQRRAILFTTLLLLAFFGIESVTAQTGRSWRDIGNTMLGQGRLDSAAIYLEKWLEADPGDESSWYNLACLRALSGNREGALEAWEASVEAGWSDLEHPLQDSDLESIRDDDRFTAALANVEERQKNSGPADFIRHHNELVSTGTYIVLLPPDYEEEPQKSYPVCVILHGSGSTELGHGRLADAIGRDDVIYVVPRAPHAHNSSHKSTGELGYTGWPAESVDSSSPQFHQSPIHYANWVIGCVDDARNYYRMTDDGIRILGHSQGAALSYITAALYPERVQGIYAYAGYFFDDYTTDAVLAEMRANNVAIHLAHGKEDGVVSSKESIGLDSILTANEIDHTLQLFEETGHGTTRAVVAKMKEWMEKGRKEE